MSLLMEQAIKWARHRSPHIDRRWVWRSFSLEKDLLLIALVSGLTRRIWTAFVACTTIYWISLRMNNCLRPATSSIPINYCPANSFRSWWRVSLSKSSGNTGSTFSISTKASFTFPWQAFKTDLYFEVSPVKTNSNCIDGHIQGFKVHWPIHLFCQGCRMMSCGRSSIVVGNLIRPLPLSWD